MSGLGAVGRVGWVGEDEGGWRRLVAVGGGVDWGR